MSLPVERFEVKRVQLEIPLLPPSLNLYRKAHWREQRRIERMWKEAVFVRWLELGRPTCSEASVTLRFLFPDRRSRDLDNYLATGSKLVGDAIKGRFIPDDSPRHLKEWRFFFGVDRGNPKTIIEMRKVSDGEDQGNYLRGGAVENPGRVQGYPG
jgi:Holliday junction resolvase RusA-like endonuclease